MTKYAKGAALERAYVKRLLLDPDILFVIRGAGSKCYGKYKVDIVAVFRNRLKIAQCKTSNIPKEERKHLRELGNILRYHMRKLHVQVVIVDKNLCEENV